MRTVVFINSQSRQGRNHVEMVRTFFEEHASEFSILDFIVVETGQDFDKCIRRLKKHSKAQCVIVGSGDGTIVSVLNALQSRKSITYGFLPLGTSNTFVKSLGLPGKAEDVLPLLLKKHMKRVSLGEVNGTLFANIADIGIPTRVAKNVTNKQKKYFGPLAYIFSGIREITRHNPIFCELELNGKREGFYTHQLLIANGTYRGPVAVSKKASVYSNTLTLAYSVSKNRREFIKDLLAFLTHTKDRRPALTMKSVKSAVIHTKPIQKIQADGEIIGTTPAKVRVVKDAIRVFTAPEAKRPKHK